MITVKIPRAAAEMKSQKAHNFSNHFRYPIKLNR